jgi:sodium transport system permease protein
MTTILTVFLKELRDSLRDRRAIGTVLFSSVFMGPLMLVLLGQFITGMEEKSARKEVYIEHIEHAPALENYILRQGYVVKAPPADAEDQIRSGRFEHAVLRLPADFGRKIADGQTADVDLVFDNSHKNGAGDGNLRKLLQGYVQEIAGQRLLVRGVSPQLMRPIDVNNINLASQQARGAQLLFMVPMFALMACLTGTIAVAIDVTAGERERGSLEPLLLNPLQTMRLVLGKWAVVTLFGCAVVVLTLSGFLLAMQFIGNETLVALFQFGPREVAAFAALLCPFAGLAASAQMLVAAFGRTFKEAQTYASYLLLVVTLIPTFTMFLSLQPAWWQGLIPALGQQMVMERVTRGEALAWTDIALPDAVAVLGIVACLALLARLLRNERVVFGRQ